MKSTLILILLATSIAKQTADEARQCLIKAVDGNCKALYTNCFTEVQCAIQFDDLFHNCIIKPGTQIYSNNCIVSSYSRITNKTLQNMFDCFVSECSLLEGQRESTPLVDTESCMQNSLLDSTACWPLTQSCDVDCMQALNVLEKCENVIQIGSIQQVIACFGEQTIVNQQAKYIAECMLSKCTE